MNSEMNAAQPVIQAAMRALKNGDRREARRLAEQLITQDPHIVQAWLILAYTSGPKAAEIYLNQAVELNPGSPQLLAALDWIKKQSPAVEEALQPTQPVASTLPAPAGAENPAPTDVNSPTRPIAPVPSKAPARSWLRHPLVRVGAGLVLLVILAY